MGTATLRPSSDPATTSETGMGILSRLTGLFSPAEHAVREADREFCTGVWRQHHDRFMRAVDRFYETAVALGRETGDSTEAAQDAGEQIAALTAPLNEAAGQVTELTRRLHGRWPVEGLVVPAGVRSACGPLPEKLSQAATKAAEAGQAAAMARIAVRTGQDPAAPTAAATRFVGDVTALIDECTRLDAAS